MMEHILKRFLIVHAPLLTGLALHHRGYRGRGRRHHSFAYMASGGARRLSGEGALRAREVKVVLLGDTGVGKSSLVLRFVTNNFKPYSESTIGYATTR